MERLIDPRRESPDSRRSRLPRKVVDEVRLRKFNRADGWATWKLHYAQGVVELPFPHDVPTVAIPNPQTFTFLTGLTLPDGSSYSMPVSDYHLDGSTHNRAPGVIKRLRLPTLGYLAWEWGGYQHAPDVEPDPQQQRPAPKYLTASLGVRARRLLNPNGTTHGEWTYTPALTLPAVFPVQKPVEMTQRVVDPLGHETTHYFSVYETGQAVNSAARIQHYGLPFTVEQTSRGRYLSRVVRDAAGQLKRSVYVRYAWDTPGSNDGHGSLWNLNRRVDSQETIYHDDGERRATVIWSDFDGLGHYRQVTTGGNFPAGNARTTYTAYNSGQTYPGSFTPPAAGTPWVLDTYQESWQEEGGARAVRQTTSAIASSARGC